ncbi:MAG: phosphoserine phosphatase SerB [Gammaproteobacteria bacterium]|nr:phosphoserine phosphatase SerB [Gammaproteobacteria bacterium]MDH5629533.1 phosphoserine phosphatase SerB [Gammaproteobacteria bacterium]
MSSLVTFNQLYQIRNGQWQAVDKKINKNNKLCLLSTDSLIVQVQSFIDLISGFEKELYFCLLKNGDNLAWQLYASYQDLIDLKIRVLESKFDYLLWPENCDDNPKLIVFDMDSTFIQIEVIDEIAKKHGVGKKVAAVTEQAMRGELDFSESLIARVACLKGLDVCALDEISQSLPLSPGIENLVEIAHQKECKIAIVSGGFMPFVNKLKQEMGLYEVKANNLLIEEGQLTGDVELPIVDAQSKANFLKQLSKKLSLKAEQIMAVGDGANDLKMMSEAGFSLAYRAKPAVEKAANGRLNQCDFDHLTMVFDWI